MQEEHAVHSDSETPAARVVNLQDLGDSAVSGPRLLEGNLSIISGVKVKLDVVVGEAELTVAELFAMQNGTVIPLDQLRDAPLAVRLDGKTIAQGTLVVVGESFGICISNILPTASKVTTE